VTLTGRNRSCALSGLPLTMSTPPENERLLGKRFKQKLRSVFSSKSRNLDVPDARPTSTNVPSTATNPVVVASTHSNSRVHPVQETIIENSHSTVEGSTDIGKLFSCPSCFDQALKSPRSWIRCGHSCAHKPSTSRQYPRKSCVGSTNARRYVLDPFISSKP